ncbi:outer membrane beta-barrel protein [Acinetobacter wuhouensis]|uniref:Porin n=1 Tax=Acinetobacter wuhouensis TaxID=1879050 RepID=A0A4V2DMX4_9GAMM|nr:outer membrane beta-barrel protein [Acinetobacter wuhouensis]RZG45317.1 hypothetical protein EXU28_11945 [Acinetobacter wuhouensis]
MLSKFKGLKSSLLIISLIPLSGYANSDINKDSNPELKLESPFEFSLNEATQKPSFKIDVSGWVQTSLAYGSNGSQLTPATGFRKEDGFTLDQMGIMIEKKINSNILSRIGPISTPYSNHFDWGFNITATYGADASFFRTYGFDEDWGINKIGNFDNQDYYASLAQAYFEFYFPILNGSNLMLGLFHSPLANEIGFALPSPAPTDFYTHTYSFFHGPAKHFGALWSSHVPLISTNSNISYELGIVRGYNNIQSSNNDLSFIGNLRWRSQDFSTWIDFENIYGNAADDSISDCKCGSPIPTDSILANDKSLNRYQSYLTISKQLNSKNKLVLEGSYGHQERALFADQFNHSPIFATPAEGGVDASWYGANVSYFYQIQNTLSTGLRAEYFNTDGVHTFVPYAGDYQAVTANLNWMPSKHLRIRPEIRYDWYSGKHKPFGSNQVNNYTPPLLDGTDKNQFSYSLDFTVFF